MRQPEDDVDATFAERCVRLALDGVDREYPNQMALVLNSAADARPPRESTPAFYGCYDWHSAVHAHWCLVRLLRLCPDSSWATVAKSTLANHLSESNLAAEEKYLTGSGREGFERPYGLAWLLQLATELHEWDDPDGAQWLQALLPLERLAVDRLSSWLGRLTHPIRSGEHSQTAFAMGLALDWARTAGHNEFASLLKTRTLDFHQHDVDAPLAYEPSGHDFLSPCLAEADLMRRVLQPEEFAPWLDGFMPGLPTDAMIPVTPSDVVDGKLAHLDGLNLSRAWMLEGIAAGLPGDDARIPILETTARKHREAGLRAVSGEHYSLSHWIGSFAVYLMTRRGIGRGEAAG